MWSSDLPRRYSLGSACALIALLSACTLEPLNSSRPDGQLAKNSESSTTKDIMASLTVDPVNTRVAQQVRNNLLFELNGGQIRPGGQYKVKLKVNIASRSLAVESDSLSPTAAQIAVTVDYVLTSKTSGRPVAGGKRRGVASFDKTPQSFANERAERDAENRAAKDVARQLRLAIAQAVVKL
jgi:LPS-assembly lipoprotein